MKTNFMNCLLVKKILIKRYKRKKEYKNIIKRIHQTMKTQIKKKYLLP